jgi:hypothetical protein
MASLSGGEAIAGLAARRAIVSGSTPLNQVSRLERRPGVDAAPSPPTLRTALPMFFPVSTYRVAAIT